MELGLIQADYAIPVLAAWVATLTIIVVKMSCAAGVAGWLWSEEPVSSEPQPVMPRFCQETLGIVLKG
jgi:hypothetical protein